MMIIKMRREIKKYIKKQKIKEKYNRINFIQRNAQNFNLSKEIKIVKKYKIQYNFMKNMKK